MQRSFVLIVCTVACSLIVSSRPATAQTDWPILPDNWWTDLDDGGYPSATYEINMGMSMSLTQSIESVEGTQITVSTTMAMVGNTMPVQSQVLDAATMTPEGGIAMMQGLGGPPNPNAPTPEEVLESLDAMVEKIQDTTCQIGDLELECTEWEVAMEGMTSRVWHAPSVPPVFMGGIVKSEATVAGQSLVTTMTSYTGSLID